MNRREAAQLLEMRQLLWPNTQAAADPVAEVDLWAAMFPEHDLNTVGTAMRSFRRDSFAPNLGQVEEAINPTPTYATALEEFRRMHREGYSTRRWSEVPWSHPLIAAFAESHFAEWGQSPDGTADGALVQAEAAFRAHMRESFGAVQRRWAAGEISAGVREALARGKRPIGDGHGDVQVVRGTRALDGERDDGQADRAESAAGHA